MTDGKKTDVPGAPLDDSVPTETPKLLQQDLGLDRRAPRPVPGFDQLKPLPAALRPDLKATTPYFPSPAKPSAEPPEYANTVISERKDLPSPMDFAKTVPSAANPVLAKIQADERAARERLVAERQLAERTALEKAANERLVADRAATGLRAPDPSLLRTDPVRLMSPQAQPARPQPLRQPLASRPLDPTPRIQEVTTDPMPREAVPPAGVRLPAQTVVQRGAGAAAAVPKTDPMQQPDVAAAMARAPAPSNAPLPPSRVAIPPPAPLAPRPPVAAPASRPPAPMERTEISRPAPMAGPATHGEIPRATQLVGAPVGGPASRPPAPIERTEISRPAPMAGPATHGEIPRATQLVGAPAGGPPSRPPGELPRSAPTAAPASRPPAPVERTEISRPAPMAAAPPGVVARVPVPLGTGPAPAAYVPIPAATVPGVPFERTDAVLPQISDPAAAARFAATTAVRAPGVPLPARMGSPAGPIIDPAPAVRPPQGPQVTPTPARQISPQDLTPSVPREAVAPARVATPPPQRAAPPPPTPPLPPPPRPALVVPPSFMDLPAAMEKPRTLGPEFATTQPGIPGPYSKPKPPPQPDPLSEEVALPVPLGQDSTDTLADRPAVGTGSDLPVASDQVLAAPASLWRRALASIFDLAAIGGAVAGLLLLAVTLTGGKPVPNHLHGLDAFFFQLQPIAIPALGLTVLLAVLYTTLGAFLLTGRTLGRLLLGIRLVDSSGKSPGAIRSLFRAVFAIFSFALFLAGFWLAVFDWRGQTLHDKLTRTFVVRPV